MQPGNVARVPATHDAERLMSRYQQADQVAATALAAALSPQLY
jgi:hypothetical protein